MSQNRSNRQGKKMGTKKTSKKNSRLIASKVAEGRRTIYDMQAEICAALASPVRLHILDLLSEGEKTVGDLLHVLQIPKANLSQHLSVLKDAGILVARKEGLFNYMSLSLPRIKDACSMVKSVLLEKISQEEEHRSVLIKELKTKR